jgi:hypothetical protein
MPSDPIRNLIDLALAHVRKQDPTWEIYQPRSFRFEVVEEWKRRIQTAMYFSGQIEWSLQLNSSTSFLVMAGMFHNANKRYNPYA